MTKSAVEVRPWTGDAAPTEAEILRLFEAEGLQPYRWSNPPRDTYSTHTHPYRKILYVVRGRITFGLPEEARQVTLGPGDRLELPPGVPHDAVVGSEGVVCLEAHR